MVASLLAQGQLAPALLTGGAGDRAGTFGGQGDIHENGSCQRSSNDEYWHRGRLFISFRERARLRVKSAGSVVETRGQRRQDSIFMRWQESTQVQPQRRSRRS